MSVDELLARVLRLPRQERACVAAKLLTSLEESGEEVAAAWASELERRSRAVAEGRAQPIDWETARACILEKLQERGGACTLEKLEEGRARPPSPGDAPGASTGGTNGQAATIDRSSRGRAGDQ